VTHDEARTLLAGYALDALEPDEARAAEAHLATCAECRLELATLREATALLASGPAAVSPPPAVRDRVLAAVHPPRHHGFGRRLQGLGLAAAALLVLVLGGLTLSLEQRLARVTQQMATQEQALALLADPAAREIVFAGTAPGSVRLVFDPGRRQGVLIAAGLRTPGPRSVYQVWLIAGRTPESAGVFRPSAGPTTTVVLDADFDRYHAVAISVEPGPVGSPQPTTRPILTAPIAGGTY
jgi:anti-sigma-K factor RskA